MQCLWIISNTKFYKNMFIYVDNSCYNKNYSHEKNRLINAYGYIIYLLIHGSKSFISVTCHNILVTSKVMKVSK